LPIRLFVALGSIGILTSVCWAAAILYAKLSGHVAVPGYAATTLTIIFFASLNLFGLGIVGAYVWRGYENTKHRPLAVVMRDESHEGKRQR
jgi:hypothetical protein